MGKLSTKSKISQASTVKAGSVKKGGIERSEPAAAAPVKDAGRSAGIDVGKAKLDSAIHNQSGVWADENDAAGWQAVVERFKAQGVTRVGMEASGGYERGIAQALRQAGFEVILHQPIQMRAFAKARLQRAKNDRIDAVLIAAFTAILGGRTHKPDPRLTALWDTLVHLEQIEADEARHKTRLEHCKDKRVRRMIEADIRRCRLQSGVEERRLRDHLKQYPDLAEKYELLFSIPGIGSRTAITLVIAMPELGTLSRERIAALAGLAPFDCDSGDSHGQRRIAGGRARVRKALYGAAVPAAHFWNPQLKAVYKRLITAGKTKKQAMVACARKLLIYANTVLARRSPWQEKTP
ncbi:IS110 family transposase [Labrys monachus]|uniref:Transposase n=1 Tax=Labrys monachus TaxID=217067 RepID=A0ABU0FPB8_9HYPH|nr:IS110 family transposase [Labrys monachus]MDQ0393948.1 transposase [Labrys monachus]MDQ0394504.1 transposase [Labrys monachus]MDQ0396419.1 transposase [Labrys monachus]MDQ0396457.1 transposase [Labrys monachus]